MIIVFETFVITILLRELKEQNVKIKNSMLIAFFIQIVIFALYRNELSILGREVYYSDAEKYWRETISILNGTSISTYGSQVGYIVWCVLIQKTSVFIWAGWNNISNILLLDIAALYGVKYLVTNNVCMRNIVFFVRCIIWNPLVVYALMRNMKDSLFLTFSIILIYLYTIYKSRNKKVLLILTIIIDIMITSIRPWGFLILPAFLGMDLLYVFFVANQNINKKLKNIFICVVLITGIIIVFEYTGVNRHLKLWIPIVFENAESLSIVQLISGPMRMLTGPGIYRAIFPEGYFQYNTEIGSVCVAIGCLAWWRCLSVFLSNPIKISSTKYGGYSMALFLLFVVIYTMQYGGSVEHRMRGIVYFLTTLFFVSNNKRVDFHKISGVVYFVVIFIGATLFSL